MDTMKDFQQALDKTHDVFKHDFADRLDAVSDAVKDLQQKGGSGIDYSSAPPRPSLMKVIKHLVNPRDNPLDGREREWHEELKSKSAEIPGMSGAVWFPMGTERKYLDFNTPNLNSPLTSAGGSNLVSTTTLDLIDILRAKSVVLRQGVTTIPAEGQISIPRKTTASTGYWFTGDGSDTITESTPVITADTYEPHFVGALTTVTHRMMVQTGTGIERIVADDLMGTLASEFDTKALQGTGANNQPTGVLNASIGSLAWGGANSPQTYSPTRFWRNDAADMIEYLIGQKSYEGNLAFLVDASSYRHLLYQEDSQAAIKYGLDADGKLFGHPVTPTTFMPANSALLGNWQEFIHCRWGNGIAIAADPGGTNFAKGSVSVRAILACDFGVRHAASFVKSAKP